MADCSYLLLGGGVDFGAQGAYVVLSVACVTAWNRCDGLAQVRGRFLKVRVGLEKCMAGWHRCVVGV